MYDVPGMRPYCSIILQSCTTADDKNLALPIKRNIP